MQRFIYTFIFIFCFITHAHASCSLFKQNFGQTIDQVIQNYNIPPHINGIPHPKNGPLSLSKTGTGICKSLPNSSIVLFTFFDNILIKIDIYNQHGKGELLNLAITELGKSDNHQHPTNNENIIKQAIWTDSSIKTVLYFLGTNIQDHPIENLTISSILHKSLFEKMVIQNPLEQAPNNIKTHNLPPSPKPSSSNNTHTPNLLDKLHENYNHLQQTQNKGGT